MSAPRSYSYIPPVSTSRDPGKLSRPQLLELLDNYQQIIRAQQAIYQLACLPKLNQTPLDFYAKVHETIASLMTAENIIIAAKTAGQDDFQYVYVKNSRDPELFDKLQTVNNHDLLISLSGHVIRSRQSMLANAEQLARLIDGSLVESQEVISQQWLAVPLICDGQVQGALSLQSLDDKELYSSVDRDLLGFISQHISTSIIRQQQLDLFSDSKAELEHAILQQDEHIQQRTNALLAANYELHRQLREKQKSESRILQNALHDTLTGLPRKTLFIDRLEQTMRRSFSREEFNYAVVVINLENFRRINDDYSFLTGDLILKEVALRIQNIIRPKDSVARFDGDEFGVLLEGDLDEQSLKAITGRIFSTIAQPCIIGGNELIVYANIGATIRQRHYQTADEVLNDADSALFHAKCHADFYFMIYEKDLQYRAIDRLKLEMDLRVALMENEIEVQFQPEFELTERLLVGVETFARWRHHEMGDINPLHFVKIAEQNDLTGELYRQILNQTFSNFCRWRQSNTLFNHLPISINLSVKQLLSLSLTSELLDALDQFKLSPTQLQIEISEAAMLDHFENCRRILKHMSDLGIQIVLDNFGRGLTSLSHLPHFPINTIKIDGSLINRITSEHKAHQLVKSIYQAAQSLNIKIVAKGIESVEQLKYLTDMGIHYGQGFLFSVPMSTEDFLQYLQTHGLSCPDAD